VSAVCIASKETGSLGGFDKGRCTNHMV